MSKDRSRHIAKNTFVLYLRLLLVMSVSLYTVRIVLDVLGVIDYGVYNVVGGIVTMLSFLSATMASSCQRFFAFELGLDSPDTLKKRFGSSLTIFALLGITIFILLETVGLWFLNNKMVIPVDRLEAANWIYQFAIFSFLFTIMTSPYNAMIIAHEDMSIYAYISIIEVVLKLVIVYLLVLLPFDKLELYGALILFVISFVSCLYILICLYRYKECRVMFLWDKNSLRLMASYASWNMIGALSNILKMNGTNILLNIFFGPIVNSARAISVQINMTFNSFVTNFYMAVRPQITKAYAVGDRTYFVELIFKSAKASYFLLLILSIPLLFETSFILNLWLKEVPEYTIIFTRLLIVNILIESINNQLVAALQAAGNIKMYQMCISTLQILILPLSYMFFYWGGSPISTLWISIVITLLSFVPQLWIVNKVVGLSITDYLKHVVLPICYVTSIACIVPFCIYENLNYSLLRFLLICIIGSLSALMTIYFIGCSKEEKKVIISIIKKRLNINSK